MVFPQGQARHYHHYTDTWNIVRDLRLYVVKRQKIPVGAIVDQEGSEIDINWEIMREMESRGMGVRDTMNRGKDYLARR